MDSYQPEKKKRDIFGTVAKGALLGAGVYGASKLVKGAGGFKGVGEKLKGAYEGVANRFKGAGKTAGGKAVDSAKQARKAEAAANLAKKQASKMQPSKNTYGAKDVEKTRRKAEANQALQNKQSQSKGGGFSRVAKKERQIKPMSLKPQTKQQLNQQQTQKSQTQQLRNRLKGKESGASTGKFSEYLSYIYNLGEYMFNNKY